MVTASKSIQLVIDRVGRLVHHEPREWDHVHLEANQYAHQEGQRYAVPEDVAQDIAFMSVPFRCGAGHDDTLGVDHLPHHAARTVGRPHQHRRDADLLCGNFLQAAE